MYINFIKRFLDILLSLLVLPFIFLVFIVIAPIIYFSDKGAIFYNAIRVGKDFKEFKMYKFRSMKVNAFDLRNADGSTYNSNDDPRVTKIGKFIRKTSIDELPQIINVLKGDMSFIGPRPILPGYDLLTYTDDMYKRMTVRPGITGYSQAYFRNSINRMQKYINDAYYVEHLSFKFDVQILVKTFMSVIKQQHINSDNYE
ncbi:conserved hypothetical protein [uncultured Paludibacter sp.]|nr:conserved hypothetical protein [uncultured Paludibacter sp.]